MKFCILFLILFLVSCDTSPIVDTEEDQQAQTQTRPRPRPPQTQPPQTQSQENLELENIKTQTRTLLEHIKTLQTEVQTMIDEFHSCSSSSSISVGATKSKVLSDHRTTLINIVNRTELSYEGVESAVEEAKLTVQEKDVLRIKAQVDLILEQANKDLEEAQKIRNAVRSLTCT